MTIQRICGALDAYCTSYCNTFSKILKLLIETFSSRGTCSKGDPASPFRPAFPRKARKTLRSKMLLAALTRWRLFWRALESKVITILAFWQVLTLFSMLKNWNTKSLPISNQKRLRRMKMSMKSLWNSSKIKKTFSFKNASYSKKNCQEKTLKLLKFWKIY